MSRRNGELEKRGPEFICTPEDYRRTFASPSGRRVLHHLLIKFFQEADDDEERLERNLTLRILRNMGVIQSVTIKAISEAMINIARKHPIIDLHTFDDLAEGSG